MDSTDSSEHFGRLSNFINFLVSHRHIENKKYACFLCNVLVGEGNLSSHLAGHRHTSNQESYDSMKRIMLEVCEFQSLVPRIERLAHDYWRDSCYAIFARSLVNNRDENANRNVKRILTQTEDLHHMHFLELAAWKTVCKIHAPSSALNSFTSAVVWASEGWKTNKTAYYRSNEVVTILRCVLPFLDQRPEEQRRRKRQRVE